MLWPLAYEILVFVPIRGSFSKWIGLSSLRASLVCEQFQTRLVYKPSLKTTKLSLTRLHLHPLVVT